MPNLNYYISVINTIMTHFNSYAFINKIKEMCRKYPNDEPRIIGRLVLEQLVVALSDVINVANGDPEITNNDIVEIIKHAGNELRKYMSKHFPKYTNDMIKIAHAHFTKLYEEKKKALLKELQTQNKKTK